VSEKGTMYRLLEELKSNKKSVSWEGRLRSMLKSPMIAAKEKDEKSLSKSD
jgi:hypothetical protein